jgi:phospholipase C
MPERRRPFSRATKLLVPLAAFAVLLPWWSSRPPSFEPFPPLDYGDRPERVDAAAFATRWPIKHVVFLIKENRTFDNMFGTFPGANGTSIGLDHGEPRRIEHGPDTLPFDVEHCYQCAITAWNNGKMDGFNRDENSDAYAYTQLYLQDIPNYWHWAEQFSLSDNFFASAHGPSFPNHLYAIAAQSGGARENPIQDKEAIDQREATLGLYKSWGCDSVEGTYVDVVDAEGVVTQVSPCLDFLTEGDLLNEAGIPWAYYAATQWQDGYLWSAYDAIRHVREDPEMWRRHMFGVDGLIRDIEDGLLPPVTWVTPRRELSEHPVNSMCLGENWTTEVVNAIMASPMWKDTAIFITWDDYGGFYDHVPPPQVDWMGFGFRVPLLVISPYTLKGHVDSELGEFSSVLRFIEDNWGLSQLTHRDRDARNLSYVFDFDQKPRPPDPLPLRDCSLVGQSKAAG